MPALMEIAQGIIFSPRQETIAMSFSRFENLQNGAKCPWFPSVFILDVSLPADVAQIPNERSRKGKGALLEMLFFFIAFSAW